MSTLVVLAYDEPHNAEEVRLKLQKLQNEYLLDLADVVVAVKDKAGKAKLHHATNLIPDDMVFQGSVDHMPRRVLLPGRSPLWASTITS